MKQGVIDEWRAVQVTRLNEVTKEVLKSIISYLEDKSIASIRAISTYLPILELEF